MKFFSRKKRDEKQPTGKWSDLYSLLHDLVYILAVITLIFVFFVRLVRVDGPSMIPTLQDGDFLALQSNFIMGDIEQGDIIVARKESFRDGEPIVKRVIATQGQTVDLREDEQGVVTVYVNGVALDEPYINETMFMQSYEQLSFPLTVDEGCIFVMGDNRNHSADSRYVEIGLIHTDQVLGRVLFVVFPGKGESGTRDFSRIGGVD